MRSDDFNNDMSVDTAFLRKQANSCVRLARECQGSPMSHELEAIGTDLMARAAQLDELLSDLTARD